MPTTVPVIPLLGSGLGKLDPATDRELYEQIENLYSLDPALRTARVRASVANPDGLLKPEMYATVVIGRPAVQKLAIPREAIVRIDTPQESEYYRSGGILPYVLRQLSAR